MSSVLAGITDVVPFVAAINGGIDPVGDAMLSIMLLTSAALFVIGVVGFLIRRNMIVMFLCTEMMFQGAALAMIAFGRAHFDVSGQVFVIFILTIAAAEAALALGLVVLMHRQKPTLSTDAWSELAEA